MMNDIVKVGDRGQIVIPTKIRKKEGIFSGGYLRIVDINGNLVLRKLEMEPLDKLIKTLQKIGMTEKQWEKIEKMRSEER